MLVLLVVVVVAAVVVLLSEEISDVVLVDRGKHGCDVDDGLLRVQRGLVLRNVRKSVRFAPFFISLI